MEIKQEHKKTDEEFVLCSATECHIFLISLEQEKDLY